MDHRMRAPQVEVFADEYEVITYDIRGHGRTGGSAEKRYTIELFAADLMALIVRSSAGFAWRDDRSDLRCSISGGIASAHSRGHGSLRTTDALRHAPYTLTRQLGGGITSQNFYCDMALALQATID